MNKSHHRLSSAFVAVSAALLVGGTAALALAQAGSASDPLVSKTYAEGTYRAAMTAKAAEVSKTQLDTAQAVAETALAGAESGYTDAEIEDALAKQVAAVLGGRQIAISLTSGSTLNASLGAEVCLTSGSASVKSGEFINLTTGKAASAGTALTRNQLYLAAESAAVSITSPAGLRVSGNYTTAAGAAGGYTAQYTAYADALSDLGLFSGSGAGYELERASTRAEGLVMLLRLLGEEAQAKAYTGAQPFTDVPTWADRYVAYAYSKGYASGMSATEYGSQRSLSLNDYMTFLLRALGYNDSAGDFSWKTAAETAVSRGILTEAHRQQIAARGVFYRDDIVYTSYQTLFLPCKGSAETLSDRLIAKGVFTQGQLAAASGQVS